MFVAYAGVPDVFELGDSAGMVDGTGLRHLICGMRESVHGILATPATQCDSQACMDGERRSSRAMGGFFVGHEVFHRTADHSAYLPS